MAKSRDGVTVLGMAAAVGTGVDGVTVFGTGGSYHSTGDHVMAGSGDCTIRVGNATLGTSMGGITVGSAGRISNNTAVAMFTAAGADITCIPCITSGAVIIMLAAFYSDGVRSISVHKCGIVNRDLRNISIAVLQGNILAGITIITGELDIAGAVAAGNSSFTSCGIETAGNDQCAIDIQNGISVNIGINESITVCSGVSTGIVLGVQNI